VAKSLIGFFSATSQTNPSSSNLANDHLGSLIKLESLNLDFYLSGQSKHKIDPSTSDID
jgi:hypothetical protein